MNATKPFRRRFTMVHDRYLVLGYIDHSIEDYAHERLCDERAQTKAEAFAIARRMVAADCDYATISDEMAHAGARREWEIRRQPSNQAKEAKP